MLAFLLCPVVVSLHRVPACRLALLTCFAFELVLRACTKLHVWICVTVVTTVTHFIDQCKGKISV